MPQAEEDHASEGKLVPVQHHARFEKSLARKVPPFLVLPLGAVLTVAVLLAIMLPLYFSFASNIDKQIVPTVYPGNISVGQVQTSGKMVVQLDFTDMNPEMHRTTFMGRLILPAAYTSPTAPGMAALPDNMTLLIVVGGTSFQVSGGDTLTDQSIYFILNSISPLYTYPFDRYTLDFRIVASLVNQTDTSSLTGTFLDIGVVLVNGVQGWKVEPSMTGYTDAKTGATGVRLYTALQRTGAVKFFSVFIVLLLWAISLAVFVIGLSFVTSSSLEVSYEVPALCVGLLFALPFVREVQPDVPDVGVGVDVCGFFFNMILVALATLLVLGGSINRYYSRLRVELRDNGSFKV